MRVLKWDSVSLNGESVHMACNVKPARWGFDAHGHDFAEIMIVEKGSLTHQSNGGAMLMCKGYVALVRPGDVHSAKAGDEGVSFCNVAFSSDSLRELSERYFKGSLKFWGGQSAGPLQFSLGREALGRLLYAAKALAGQERDKFVCDRFLLNAIHELAPYLGLFGEAHPESARVPDWLAAAHEEMRTPGNLRLGVKRLFKLAGRCREHVSRSFKTVYGMSPEAYVNELRLLNAERLLMTGDMKIPELASSCGMRNLSHFHKLFRARYGMSPHRYRIERRSAVI